MQRQQDHCLEEKTNECSLDIKENLSNTETIRTTLEIIFSMHAPGNSKQIKTKTKSAVVIIERSYKKELEFEIEESKRKIL